MRLRIITMLTMCICTAAIEQQSKNQTIEEKVKEKKARDLIIRSHHIITMDISPHAKEQFTNYLAGFCLSTEHMPLSTYMKSYLRWEESEFLDGVRKFLDPTERNPDGAIFNHLPPNFASNCSMIDEKQQRDVHHTVAQEALFDNYMYDQMTRNEWTRLYL